MLFRKKVSEEPCVSCDRSIRHGQKVCKCGTATKHMNFDERTQYEVDQWRRYRAATG